MSIRYKQVKVIEVLIHMLFWVFITLMPIMSRPYPAHNITIAPWQLLSFNILLAVQFYFNAFFLIPIVLNKYNHFWLYCMLTLISLIAIGMVSSYLQPAMIHPPFAGEVEPRVGSHPIPGFFFMPLMAITAAGFAYRYLTDRFIIINNEREITNATLTSELAFLRSQISPHFIFNVINSLVALSRFKPAVVEPTLIKLSTLLRYMLYLTDEQKVTLAKKAGYLQSYVELQQLRYQDTVEVNLHINLTAPEKFIEPMLLVPFVENAFKHGIGDIAEPVIIINLNASDKQLNFRVENKYADRKSYNHNEHGIGLVNVKRRLELLYADKHQLIITQNNNLYKVDLKIELK